MVGWPCTRILSDQVYNLSDYDLFNYKQYDYESPFNTSKRYHQPSEELIDNCSLSTKEPNSTWVNSTTEGSKDYTCDYIFKLFVTTILCFVGFVGNAVTIAVLRRDRDPQRQKSTNWLLKALAVTDTIYLAFACIYHPMNSIAWLTDAFSTVRNFLNYLTKYLYPFAEIAHTMTIWMVVLVTVDRYLAICKPLRTDWRSLHRLKITVGVLFILAVIVNLPNFLEAFSERAAIRNKIYYEEIYEVGLDFLFRSVGPLVVLVILNGHLFWTIKALNKKQHVIALHTKEEKRLTVMLIIVVIIFVVCQVPMSVLTFAFRTTVFFPETVSRPTGARCVLKLARSLVVLNSSINFFVYSLIWRKFNRILVRMMMSSCCKNKTDNQI